MKYSIVIPTTGKKELIEPCIQSILKNTSADMMKNIELVVVVNGSKKDVDSNIERNLTINCRLNKIVINEKIGYTKAANIGIQQSHGEFVILMNDDCQILDFGANDEWLNILHSGFTEKTAITGVRMLFSEETKRNFLVFFLVMIKRKIFDEVGLLDEIFNPGGGEDIDFCARVEKAGYEIKTVPDDNQFGYTTTYPVWHQGEKTVHGIPDWEAMFKHRMNILKTRNEQFKYSKYADVTAYISTKGRYETTLPLAITSILNQTLLPSHLVIIQDDYESYDMRQSSTYSHLFSLIEQKGIKWKVIFGKGKGQVLNHQTMIEESETSWLWRVDDDNVAEYNVLETLCSHIQSDVGAIAGAVVDPKNSVKGETSVYIKDIDSKLNKQWLQEKGGIYSAEHLYSSFLYRKAASTHGYCLELSPVGHREETIFTHEMFLNGWALLIDLNVVTWHLRSPSGGIRSFNDAALWEHDEAIFRRKMKVWKREIKERKVINLDCGIGDHWVFKPLLNKIVEENTDKEIIIASAHPSVITDDVPDELLTKIKIISVDQGKKLIGEEAFTNLNVYYHCIKKNWKRPIKEAFENLYL